MTLRGRTTPVAEGVDPIAAYRGTLDAWLGQQAEYLNQERPSLPR